MVWFKLGKVLVLTYLWYWWITTTNTMLVNAANDSLKPGDTLDINNDLCSEKSKYCIGFTRPYTSELAYLSIIEGPNGGAIVWVGDRNQPIVNNSTVVPKIEFPGGDPLVLYSSPQPINNTMATLLDTGNYFVLQQIHPNGTKTVLLLWQSFDFPYDTLIPGMKLGVNHKEGHKWSLVSRLTSSLVTPGPFSLEWEPIRSELIIKRHGKVYWTTGKLRDNRFFEHISEEQQGMYEYTTVYNKDESYFMLNTSNEEYNTWTLSETGVLASGEDIAHADLCYGYNTDGGCRRWEEIPTCREPEDVFERKVGYPNYKNTTTGPNTSFGPSDCLTSCWRNCDCLGFREFYANGTGCTFFIGNSTQGIQPSSGGDSFNMLVTKTQHKGTKKCIWISTITASALLIACPTMPLRKENMCLKKGKEKEWRLRC